MGDEARLNRDRRSSRAANPAHRYVHGQASVRHENSHVQARIKAAFTLKEEAGAGFSLIPPGSRTGSME